MMDQTIMDHMVVVTDQPVVMDQTVVMADQAIMDHMVVVMDQAVIDHKFIHDLDEDLYGCPRNKLCSLIHEKKIDTELTELISTCPSLLIKICYNKQWPQYINFN